MPIEDHDYYQILEVDPTANDKAIFDAYKWMMRKIQAVRDQYHDLDAEQRMKDVNEAYRILANPAKRAFYDYQRASRNAPRTEREAAARRQIDEERARQRAERAEQKLHIWRRRSNNLQPVSDKHIEQP